MNRRVFYALLTGGALALGGCGGGGSGPPAAEAQRQSATTAAERAAAPQSPPKAAAPATTAQGPPSCERVQALRSTRVAYGAVARRALAVYDRPGGRPVERFGRRNPNGVPTVFGVVGRKLDARCRTAWLRVRLPRRPNHRVAWVRAADVAVEPVQTRILVDLSDRRVTLYRDGRPVLTVPAAIGSSATPTPTGTFYVDQRLLSNDPGGPFGPGAIGIAAYSEVLTGWAQGGPIAIHGTNRPDLIGQAVSNGCIRVRNDVLRRLFAATLAGTPVVIRA